VSGGEEGGECVRMYSKPYVFKTKTSDKNLGRASSASSVREEEEEEEGVSLNVASMV